ncbi:MAG: UrcA family protein [Caulobacter sp.]|nr:UrcA family protein [Caulobacter sp.]
MNILIASTAALMVLSGATFATAAEAPSADTTRIAVHTGKLDLANPRDAKVAMARIDTAAMEACGAQRGSFTEVKRAVAASACHRDAVANAVAQLKSSQASLVRIDNRNH